MEKPIKVGVECWELVAKGTGEICGRYMSKLDAVLYTIYYTVRYLNLIEIKHLKLEFECNRIYEIK